METEFELRSGITDKLAENGYDLPAIRNLLASTPLDQPAIRKVWQAQVSRAEHRHELVVFKILLSTLTNLKASLSPATNALLNCYQGVYAACNSEYTNAEEHFREALRLTQTEFYPDLAAVILVRYGQMLTNRSKYNEAEDILLKALMHAKNSQIPHIRASTYNHLARLHLLKSSLRQALDYYQEAHVQVVMSGSDRDYFNEGKVLNGLGKIHFFRREWEKAATYLEEALDVRTKIGDLVGQIETRTDMGIMSRYLGKYDNAGLHFGCGLAIAEQINHRLLIAEICGQQAKLYHITGETNKAIALWQKAIAVHREVKNQISEANSLYNLATVYDEIKAHFLAQEFYDKALELAKELDERTILPKIYIGLADLLLEVWNTNEQHVERALELFREGILLMEQSSNKANLPSALLKMAKAVSKWGGNEGQREAMGYYSRCLRLLEQRIEKGLAALPANMERVQIFAGIADCYHKLGEFPEAFDYYFKAITLMESLPDGKQAPLKPTQIYTEASKAALDASAFMEAFSWYERGLKVSDNVLDTNELKRLGILLAPYKNMRRKQTDKLRLYGRIPSQ
jgi:tetratricopeptide (TPR) repeat protein